MTGETVCMRCVGTRTHVIIRTGGQTLRFCDRHMLAWCSEIVTLDDPTRHT